MQEDIRKWQSRHLNLLLIGKKIFINKAIPSKIWFLLAYDERPPEKIIQNRKKLQEDLRKWQHVYFLLIGKKIFIKQVIQKMVLISICYEITLKNN